MNKVEPSTTKVKLPSTDPRLQFRDIINNFPIDIFDIPRPFKSRLYAPGQEISDSFCVMGAFTLLGIPHDIDYESAKAEPWGWLIGPHLSKRQWTEKWRSRSKKGKKWTIKQWTMYYSCWEFCSGWQLKECIRINPWLVVTDSCVQLAIAILRTECETGTPIAANRAKSILEELGFSGLMPVASKERRTEDPFLRFCDNHPVYLVTAVRLYEFIINTCGREDPEERWEERIRKAFNFIFDESIPRQLLERITDQRFNITTATALGFISHEIDTSYDALKKRFFTFVKNVSDTEVLSYVDEITDNSGNKKKIIEEFKMQWQSEK